MKILTLLEVVQKSNEYLDSNPIGKRGTKVVEVIDRVINPSGNGYNNLLETFIYDRFVQIKIYDNDNLIEYQLIMRPWDNAFQLNTWFDGKKPECKYAHESVGMKFTIDEAEFFMESTVTDMKDITLSDIRSVKALMDRFYKHFNVTPVDCEV